MLEKSYNISFPLCSCDYSSSYVCTKKLLFIIGNSSSGIIEAPFYKVPCINIGRRQIGRYRSTNVIDTDTSLDSIRASLIKVQDVEFIEAVKNCKSPYGDGESTAKLIELLVNHRTTQNLLVKDLTC